MVDGRGAEREVVGGIDGGMGLSVDGDCGWWWVCVVCGGWEGQAGEREREERKRSGLGELTGGEERGRERERYSQSVRE